MKKYFDMLLAFFGLEKPPTKIKKVIKIDDNDINRFNNYTDNSIKRFVVNSYIDKDVIRNMTISDVRLIDRLLAFGDYEFKESLSLVDKVVMDKETNDELADEVSVISLHNLPSTTTYDDLYIDSENKRYMRLVTDSNIPIGNRYNEYYCNDPLYLIILKDNKTNSLYGMVLRLVTNNDPNTYTLVVHPTKYALINDSIANYSLPKDSVSFIAIESLTQNELIFLTNNRDQVILKEKYSSKFYNHCKVSKTKAYATRDIYWYAIMPQCITLTLREEEAV